MKRERLPEVRAKGKWENGTDYEYEFAYCSECGRMVFADWNSHAEAREKVVNFHEEYKYCPGCGAKMEEGVMSNNVAAMREALETLLNIAYEVQDANSEYGAKTSVPAQFIIDVAKPALIGMLDSAKEETAEEKPYHVTVHCDNTGIKVKGALTDIGSTCDTDASGLASFLRIAEHWWHTYCKEARND